MLQLEALRVSGSADHGALYRAAFGRFAFGIRIGSLAVSPVAFLRVSVENREVW